MIPDHLIDQGAAAIYAATAFGDKFAIDAWHDMADDSPIKTTTRMYARAALDAVAAEIWDEATEAQADYEWFAERGRAHGMADPQENNPYREATRRTRRAQI